MWDVSKWKWSLMVDIFEWFQTISILSQSIPSNSESFINSRGFLGFAEMRKKHESWEVFIEKNKKLQYELVSGGFAVLLFLGVSKLPEDGSNFWASSKYWLGWLITVARGTLWEISKYFPQASGYWFKLTNCKISLISEKRKKIISPFWAKLVLRFSGSLIPHYNFKPCNAGFLGTYPSLQESCY